MLTKNGKWKWGEKAKSKYQKRNINSKPLKKPQIIEVYGKSDDAQKYATAFTLNQNSYSKEEQSWKKPSIKYNN